MLSPSMIVAAMKSPYFSICFQPSYTPSLFCSQTNADKLGAIHQPGRRQWGKYLAINHSSNCNDKFTNLIRIATKVSIYIFHQWIHHQRKNCSSYRTQTRQFSNMAHVKYININASCWRVNECSNDCVQDEGSNLKLDSGLHNNDNAENNQTRLKNIMNEKNIL